MPSEAQKKAQKAHYERHKKNPEFLARRRAWLRQWREKNKDRDQKLKQAWDEKNKDKKRLSRKKSYERHRDRIAAARLARYAANPAYYREQRKREGDRTNPGRAIKRAVRAFRRGDLGFDELSKYCRDSLDEQNARLKKLLGDDHASGRDRKPGNGTGETDSSGG